MKYVVACSFKEAELVVDEIGHDTISEAKRHLEEVKAPPTDSYYAGLYKIFKVKT